MATPHASFFSYSLSKLYPFRWFTPLVLIVFIILATLFSILNYSPSGFEQVSQTSPDPNATVSGDGSKKWPSFIFDKGPVC